MFGSYLQGFIGKFIAVVGFLISLPTGCFLAFFATSDEFVVIFSIGFLMMLGGGYMSYLSGQTVRIGDNLAGTESDPQGSSFVKGENVYLGSRDISDPDYQLYLVEKYDIRKNDTLNVYTMNRRSYNSIDDALGEASQKDISTVSGD